MTTPEEILTVALIDDTHRMETPAGDAIRRILDGLKSPASGSQISVHPMTHGVLWPVFLKQTASSLTGTSAGIRPYAQGNNAYPRDQEPE